MPRALAHRFGRRFFLCAGLLAAGGSLLRADQKPVASPGCHLVPIERGGKTMYIQVKNELSPYRGVNDSGDSKEPDHFSFNKTSPLANKSYFGGEGAAADGNSTYQKDVEKSFVTQSYFPHGADNADKSIAGLNSRAETGSAEAYLHKATGYDKSFLTASADVNQHKTSDYASMTSGYQGQAALLGGHDVKKFAYTQSSKKFEGQEAAAVKRDLDEMNQGLVNMKDLPNRPLTIDEVRDLINHGVKPHTDQKPAPASKPLNAPDYVPEAPPALPDGPNEILKEDVPSGGSNASFKDDGGVPAPGMMAAPQKPLPEDAEPLPTK